MVVSAQRKAGHHTIDSHRMLPPTAAANRFARQLRAPCYILAMPRESYAVVYSSGAAVISEPMSQKTVSADNVENRDVRY